MNGEHSCHQWVRSYLVCVHVTCTSCVHRTYLVCAQNMYCLLAVLVWSYYYTNIIYLIPTINNSDVWFYKTFSISLGL